MSEPVHELPAAEAVPASIPSRKFVSYIIEKARFDLPTHYQPIKSLGT